MRVIADRNIPRVDEAFRTVGTVQCYPGRELTAADVREADVLLVRSVTPVNRALLAGSRVKFVGSATIGTDHVEEAYLREQGLAFAHAPGSNATSVVEYVLAALFRLAVRKKMRLRGKTVGIVGCGNIGGRLAERLLAFGMRVLQNDPPLAQAAAARGERHDYVSLEVVLENADVVTLHVPLTREGPHATYHLLDEEELFRMKPGAWLVNTARGPVISNAALRDARADGPLDAVVLDVWEAEPTPDPELLRQVDLGTPHIAGYSYDGKVQGTIMLYRAVTEHFGLPQTWDYEAALAPAPDDDLRLIPPDPFLPATDWTNSLIRQMYDIGADHQRLQRVLTMPSEERGAYFSALRKNYPRRRAFGRHRLRERAIPAPYQKAVKQGLQITLLG